jgi:predicted phosphodiesterase
MQFAFDLISDLHLETWEQDINWDSFPTSPYAVVAGDICRDIDLLVTTLKNLTNKYQAVFYIDGNDEHVCQFDTLNISYARIKKKLSTIDRLVYLQDNVAVINGVAIIGTNGWWGFDLDLTIDPEDTKRWWIEKWQTESEIVSRATADTIQDLSRSDATYLISSINKLQTHMDVKNIVVVTHTVPHSGLIRHDIDLDGSYKFNTMGNTHMELVLEADRMKKITTWCFGHYHGSVDQTHNNVRYVNNCRGRGGSLWAKHVYNPLRIELEV